MPEYRIEYSKKNSARWLSHLELIRTFIRALRRSGLPLVFSQGFNPHPKLSYGPSLGVGVAGMREYLDMDLVTGLPLAECLSAIAQQFPPGIEIRCLLELPPSAPGLGKMVNCAWYRLVLPAGQNVDAWQQTVDRLVGDDLPIYYQRPKDGKLFDARSALAACRLAAAEDGLILDLLVELGGGAVSLRGLVETLFSLAATAGCFEPARVTRMALLRHNGGFVNPIGERKQLWEA